MNKNLNEAEPDVKAEDANKFKGTVPKLALVSGPL